MYSKKSLSLLLALGAFGCFMPTTLPMKHLMLIA